MIHKAEIRMLKYDKPQLSVGDKVMFYKHRSPHSIMACDFKKNKSTYILIDDITGKISRKIFYGNHQFYGLFVVTTLEGDTQETITPLNKNDWSKVPQLKNTSCDIKIINGVANIHSPVLVTKQ